MQKAHCPACGATIQGAQINMQSLLAVCVACDVVHPLSDTLSDHHSTTAMAGSDLKPPIDDRGGTPPEALMRLSAGPPGLTVTVEDEVLSIRRRWWQWSPHNLFMMIFVVIWDGFLVVWYTATAGGMLMELANGDLGSAMRATARCAVL